MRTDVSSPDPATGAPRAVGPYRLLRRIGEGAMSTVYLGCDRNGRKPLAIKVLAPHLAKEKPFITRFLREARLGQLLSHPNLVHGLDHGFDSAQGQHYLTLEFVDGPNALSLLHRTGPLPVGLVVHIGIEIARALGHLHEGGYVHRDVKPDNIFLGPKGVVKLGDLGLAKRVSDASDLSLFHQGVGTPHYMPLEQAVCSELVDARSDLYALGATLYHLATGRVPFAGDSHYEIIRLQEEGKLTPAREFRSAIPGDLDRILTKSLALNPVNRFQSADELIRALQATRLATVLSRVPDPVVSDAAASPAARTQAGQTKVARGNRRSVVQRAFVSVAVVGGIAYAWACSAINGPDSVRPARLETVSPLPTAQVPIEPDLEIPPSFPE